MAVAVAVVADAVVVAAVDVVAAVVVAVDAAAPLKLGIALRHEHGPA